MGLALTPRRIPFAAAFLCLGLVTSAGAQGTGAFAEVFDSPIPAERGMPPEVAPGDGEPATDIEPTLPGGEAPPVTAEGSDEPGVSVLRPGGDGPVRVVFDQETDGDPATDPAAPDSEQAAWQQQRDRRFRRAPQADPLVAAPVEGPLEPIEPPNTQLLAGAKVRELDKMTGQVRTFTIPVGAEAQDGRLIIRVEACRATGSGAQHGTVAFMKIWDTKTPGDPVFSGWMFAESPALSAMDHPRYDVWVLECTEGTTSTTSN